MLGSAPTAMLRPGPALLALPVLLLSASLAARADVVNITNGDRLSGQVVEVKEGSLTFSTEYAGTLQIAWEKVQSVQTDQDVLIRMNDDRVVKGRIVATEDGKLKLQEEGMPAAQEVPKEDLVKLTSPGVIWHGTFTVSAKAESGNSVSKDVFIRAEVTMETKETRTVLRGNYARETDDGVLTEDNYYALLKFDLHLNLQSFAYLSNEARRDRFEDLQYRDVSSVGYGFTFSKSDTFTLWAEAGPAFMVEELSDGTSDSWFGGRGAVHGKLMLPFGLEVRDDFTIWPNFETWANWQLHNEATLSSRVLRGIHVSFSVITDIDNEPSLGREDVDNKYLLGLSHKF